VPTDQQGSGYAPGVDGAKVKCSILSFEFRVRSAAQTELQQRDHMTPAEYSDVKKLYKFAIARDSFLEISKTCEHLIAGGFQSVAPSYYAMAAGIVTLYARPFAESRSSRIGTLSTS
jgi:hypothetical protein